MKTAADIRARLESELNLWFKRQIEHPHDRFYLYYIETNARHDGGFIIARDQPANKEYKLVSPEHIMRNWTVKENANFFQSMLYKLPILEVEVTPCIANK